MGSFARKLVGSAALCACVISAVTTSVAEASENSGDFVAVFTTPAGDPVASPVADGLGQNEFVYDTGTPGVLRIKLEARLDGEPPQPLSPADFSFDIDDIPGSTQSWVTNRDGSRITLNDRTLSATVTFTGLPAENTAFGRKTARLRYRARVLVSQSLEVFYPGMARNHPGGRTPNWFYYYSQNETGHGYQYGCSDNQKSSTVGRRGNRTISICDEAYLGDKYFLTDVVGGQLVITGESAVNRYYANFIGVLRHEQDHAENNLTEQTPVDTDSDGLSNTREITVTHTNPNQRTSARDAPGSVKDWKSDSTRYTDDEVFANGPVEQCAEAHADTSEDWAAPGTNKAQ
jgi:hypothetical protein